MLFTNVVVATGLVYAGVKTLAQNARRRRAGPRAYRVEDQPQTAGAGSAAVAPFVATAGAEGVQNGAAQGEPDAASGGNEAAPPRPGATIDASVVTETRGDELVRQVALLPSHRNAAATSLFCAVGGIFLPPLTLVSVPLTVYSSIPLLEMGYQSLYTKQKLSPALLSATLLVGALLGEHYFSASTFSWLYHSFRELGQHVQATGRARATQWLGEMGDLFQQAMGGTPREVWVVNDNVEVKVPFEHVKPGDTLAIGKGEFVPVAGLVVAGTAQLQSLMSTGTTANFQVAAGDWVQPRMFVTEGRIRMRTAQ